MGLPVTFVWTHDSIGLGEDGPTHQPVEHLWALRAIPGLDVVRPGDANETAVAWRTILERTDHPAGLCLTRQKLPVFDRGTGLASAEGTASGGYVLAEAAGGEPEVILIGTGSEVQIALAARAALQQDGIPTRVVSMPCLEWFAEQDQAYRDEVLPPRGQGPGQCRGRNRARLAGVRRRPSASASAWSTSVRRPHYQKLYDEFGITPERAAHAARDSLARLPPRQSLRASSGSKDEEWKP